MKKVDYKTAATLTIVQPGWCHWVAQQLQERKWQKVKLLFLHYNFKDIGTFELYLGLAKVFQNLLRYFFKLRL